MPAKSKAQQRFMGLVHALQKGKIDPSRVSKKVKDVAKDMDSKDVDDYAGTKHKNLPNKVRTEMDITLDKDMMAKLHKDGEIEVDGNVIKFLERATPKSNPEYFKGLSKKDKDERERVIKKRAKMDSDDPDAYKGFRSDKGVKTKPSKWNAKFKKMYGEMTEDQKTVFHEKLSAKIKKALKNKAKKANAPQGALTTVYNKGLAAWRTGHRPGASQHAWAMARVNSFLAGGPARKVDSAQWNQVKKHRKKK